MLEFPIHLDIESTNRCQLKCGMCPRIKMKRKQGLMEFDILKKIVDEGRGKVQTCYLHQIGEPLLHPDIVKFINYTADAGIQTSISTNCMELTEEKSMELLESKLHELTLCVDSLDKTIYEKMREGSDFHKIMWNVSRFLDLAKNNYDLKITIQLIKTILNIGEVDKWKEYFDNKAQGTNYEILVKEFSTFANTVKDIGIEPDNLRYRCGKVYTTMTINWDGTIVLCCRDYDHYTVLGNVKKNTLKEIWDGEIYRELRARFKNKDFPDFCKNC
jgi:MoaA/NifB/PqqE/SkfB family radical SAM enzyme